jgi:hypothetical protein
MERIIYRKTLDLFKGGTQFVLQGFQTSDNMARSVEIGFTSGSNTYEISEDVTACAYITDAKGVTSIVQCIVRGDEVTFDVPKIATEGIAEVVVKLIGISPYGATEVIASPKFALEVWDSGVSDDEAEDSPDFSALENSLAQSEAYYKQRLLGVEVDENLTFKAKYADGTEYETTAIKDGVVSNLIKPKGVYDPAISYEMFDLVNYFGRVYLALQPSVGETPTGGDDDEYWSDIFAINTALENAYTSINGDEIVNEVVSTLEKSLATPIANLLVTVDKPTLVKWDETTINTPYKEDNKLKNSGFAIVSGDISNNHTIIAWTNGGDENAMFIKTTTDGAPSTYQKFLSEKVLKTEIPLHGGIGRVWANEQGTFLGAYTSADEKVQGNALKVTSPLDTRDDEEALKLVTEGGVYKIYGEHNRHLIEAFGYIKMASGDYRGNGDSGSSKQQQCGARGD